MKSNLIGVIVLAAGASHRMGAAKQTLKFKGETLLRRSAETALQTSRYVVIALGARREILRREIEDLPVAITENKDWQSGMGGSLKISLAELLKSGENFGGVIVMVCDQPFVSVDLLGKISAEFEQTDSLIVACEYENTRGVPALFSEKLFAEMLSLESSDGAKKLIKKYASETAVVSFPEGAFDVDTPADYERLMKNFN